MAEIKIGRMVLGVCQTNCYFLYRDGEHEAIVVDPADRGANIYGALQKNGFRVAGILLTHGHFDHIWGLDGLRDAANAAAEAEGLEPVKAYACAAERELLKSARMNVSEQAGRACETYADVYVKDGQEITLTALEYRMLLILMENKGRTLPRSLILEKLWDSEGNFVNDNTLSVYMKRLRKKLGDTAEGQLIQTVRGVGYRMEK